MNTKQFRVLLHFVALFEAKEIDFYSSILEIQTRQVERDWECQQAVSSILLF